MNKDLLLIAIVTLMSVGANLPKHIAELSGVDQKLLVIGLLLVVSISLVRYSKFVLVLAVAILAFGANLPNELAVALNVQPRVLMLTLIAIVGLSLANRILKLPSGLDKQQGLTSNEGAHALFRAIANDRPQIARRLLDAGTNINARSRQGYTALMIASSHGYDDMVKLLLAKGADFTIVDAEGRNAMQIAREAGRDNCVALLLNASKSAISGAGGQQPLPST